MAVGAALLSLLWLVAGGAGLARGPALLTLGDAGALHLSLRSDALGGVMLLLVAAIGWVITRYSQPYLDGKRGQPRYERCLMMMLTLAAVTLLVLTNNLLVLAAAWGATSLALHGLLTFFDQRPRALIAAHKQFIASRVADLCLIAAVVLVGRQLGTLEIDQAVAAAAALPSMPGALQAAALLVVFSALLKAAQLPVHGWLIQVMEAPTPVSALLHAGVSEGNGGDLRIGLPMQSLHDGQALHHTPLRLSVFIQAPQQPIDEIIARHATFRHLLDHEWLNLFRLENVEGVRRCMPGGTWETATDQ